MKQKSNLILTLCILCILIIVFMLYVDLSFINREGFTDTRQVISCYIITMKKQERLEHIATQLSKMNSSNKYRIDAFLVDAVVGKTLDIDELVQKGQLVPEIKTETVNAFNGHFTIRKNEVGCYLSHMSVYDIVQKKGSTNPSKYSIIFEDDFIVNNDFMTQMENIISTIENNQLTFDLIMLGMIGQFGDQVYDSIYNLKCSKDDVCFQTHAILMNNDSAEKLLNVLYYIDDIIDVQLFKKNNEGKLTIYRVNPSISFQDEKFGTDIRTLPV